MSFHIRHRCLSNQLYLLLMLWRCRPLTADLSDRQVAAGVVARGRRVFLAPVADRRRPMALVRSGSVRRAAVDAVAVFVILAGKPPRHKEKCWQPCMDMTGFAASASVQQTGFNVR